MIVKCGVNLMWVLVSFNLVLSISPKKFQPGPLITGIITQTMAPLKIVFMHASEVTIAARLPKMLMVASSWYPDAYVERFQKFHLNYKQLINLCPNGIKTIFLNIPRTQFSIEKFPRRRLDSDVFQIKLKKPLKNNDAVKRNCAWKIVTFCRNQPLSFIVTCYLNRIRNVRQM